MTTNLKLLLAVSLLFGVSTGIYEFILPLFLQANGVDLKVMGGIFSLAGLAVVIARIYMGGLSDRWGRKPLYGWALLFCGLATGAAAWLSALGWQLLLKTVRETAALTRETLHPIVLYEERQAGFLNLIGKFRGIEFLFQAGGTLLAGLILRGMGGLSAGAAYHLTLQIAGAILLVGALCWALGFVEHRVPAPQRVMSLRELFSIDLHPNLLLIAISGIIFTFGMMISHSFYLPLFFTEHFKQKADVVSVVLIIHRLTIALPLLVVGNLRLKNLRAWYIGAVVIEGVTMAASPLFSHFWLSASVFLLHDLIGAGIWVPIQSTLIQRYSREESRGIEVGKVLAWGSLGAIAGPLTAGLLASYSPVLPFFASGIFMALAAVPLLWLNPRLPLPTSQQVAEVVEA
ncbi:MAG: MFS transporter [Armatimonadota bacterium]